MDESLVAKGILTEDLTSAASLPPNPTPEDVQAMAERQFAARSLAMPRSMGGGLAKTEEVVQTIDGEKITIDTAGKLTDFDIKNYKTNSLSGHDDTAAKHSQQPLSSNTVPPSSAQQPPKPEVTGLSFTDNPLDYGPKDAVMAPPVILTSKPKVVDYKKSDSLKPTYNRSNKSEGARQPLPSNYVPYDFDALFLVPFSTLDLLNLVDAYEMQSTTRFIDTMEDVINIPVRDLTISDFNYLLYKQRIQSYVKSPNTIEWQSRYGNINELKVDKTTMIVETLDMSKEEYAKWKAKGIQFPTVADLEFRAENQELDKRDSWIYERAKYIVGASWEEKKQRVLDDMSLLEDIREFKKVSRHGVESSITVTDPKFNPSDWYLTLQEHLVKAKSNAIAVHGAFGEKSQEFAEARINIGSIIAEIAKVKHAIENNIPMQAEEERVAIGINLLSFFPAI